jgi:hypothetical protein
MLQAKFHMMDLNERWAPLCSVLGTPIPDEPFPRANDAEAIEGLAGQIFAEAGSRWAGIFPVIGVLGYGIWCQWRAMCLQDSKHHSTRSGDLRRHFTFL